MTSSKARRDAEFSDFVASRRDRLRRLAYLLCGDDSRAEDIVQAALTKVYVAWSRVRRADSVDAYVRRAVVNAHLTEVTRPWQRERPGLEPETEAGSRSESRTGVGAERESDDDLWTALGALPPGQRRVVVLRHYWGMSVDETAADLGISAGTVKSQTSDALARLRVTLTPERSDEREAELP
ncbi:MULTISPECIES: SigE family RNA polymerase sigma factor [unclassified Nocardioides]|uniref:SigE family RNA polymerase sigma factor n=1 Tax=unclassified Nocardioides TaxID=2615069 RepID=UPI0006F3C95F|nr:MULTISPECIES: SigE family RNA polymerase sigma factor [unclassified Nocardioides]KQY55542.1 RNA polymerase subunit sigma-24 [Nocardioides sp. Root140]KRF12722.1 RNA polymerase subunit sigma-24 [Nocardioides sp. Soil796]